jgi:hypothetical protein
MPQMASSSSARTCRSARSSEVKYRTFIPQLLHTNNHRINWIETCDWLVYFPNPVQWMGNRTPHFHDRKKINVDHFISRLNTSGQQNSDQKPGTDVSFWWTSGLKKSQYVLFWALWLTFSMYGNAWQRTRGSQKRPARERLAFNRIAIVWE